MFFLMISYHKKGYNVNIFKLNRPTFSTVTDLKLLFRCTVLYIVFTVTFLKLVFLLQTLAPFLYKRCPTLVMSYIISDFIPVFSGHVWEKKS